MLNPVFFEKVQGQKHPGRRGSIELMKTPHWKLKHNKMTTAAIYIPEILVIPG